MQHRRMPAARPAHRASATPPAMSLVVALLGWATARGARVAGNCRDASSGWGRAATPRACGVPPRHVRARPRTHNANGRATQCAWIRARHGTGAVVGPVSIGPWLRADTQRRRCACHSQHCGRRHSGSSREWVVARPALVLPRPMTSWHDTGVSVSRGRTTCVVAAVCGEGSGAVSR